MRPEETFQALWERGMKDTTTRSDYREAIKLLDAFINMERSVPSTAFFRNGGERMRQLLQRAGQPQLGIPAVHIAGTKGKGSVAGLAGAALAANGFKTGVYTSPHVGNLRERIAVNGSPVSERAFAEAADDVLREASAMRDEGLPPSYFEILTVIALSAFQAAGAEVIFLEAGLGGRLDATNLLPDLRLAAVGLTPISMDHEDILGHSLTEIATEKVEIIHPRIPVVTAPQAPDVARLIARTASRRDARLFAVGEDIKFETTRKRQPDKPELGQRVNFETWRNVYLDITLSMLGEHQVENAALALGLAELLLEYMDREPLDSLVLKRAWRGLAFPARLEVAGRSPWMIVDGAHNPASAWAAAETLPAAFAARDRTMVFGVARDKNWRAMLRILVPLFQNVILSPYDSPRAVDTAELAGFMGREFSGIKTAEALDISHALAMARDSFTPADGLIFVTGSLYLAGEALAVIRRGRSERA
ncbi:MAG: hypothetical protein LBE84_06870 [Planctomycetota bacterium]|jgi:dihydrofolate synthase/folylpolyglutamate synthase|nr:hypothetical protein [Planctomycetota bacterium]